MEDELGSIGSPVSRPQRPNTPLVTGTEAATPQGGKMAGAPVTSAPGAEENCAGAPAAPVEEEKRDVAEADGWPGEVAAGAEEVEEEGLSTGPAATYPGKMATVRAGHRYAPYGAPPDSPVYVSPHDEESAGTSEEEEEDEQDADEAAEAEYNRRRPPHPQQVCACHHLPLELQRSVARGSDPHRNLYPPIPQMFPQGVRAPNGFGEQAEERREVWDEGGATEVLQVVAIATMGVGEVHVGPQEALAG